MIVDPRDPPEEQIRKLRRMVEALMRRAERGHLLDGEGAFGLFQSAVALQGEVWARRRDLEAARDTLDRTSDELEVHRDARRQMQRTLADAMEAMSGGFALFVEGRLRACNNQFRALLPDIAERIEPGIGLDRYFKLMRDSRFRAHDAEAAPPGPPEKLPGDESFVLPLIGDRFVQITQRRAASGAVAVLQSEITQLVRRNRRETVRLIDSQAQLMQAALENMRAGVCTFSAEAEVLIANARFANLLRLPPALAAPDARLAEILRHVEQEAEASGLAAQIPRWREALEAGEDIRHRLRRRDGAALDLQAAPLPDGGFIVTVADVTAETLTTEALERRVAARTAELTAANQRLRRQNAELERVQQELRAAKEASEAAAQSRTRFLAAASHDLLQPISAAKLFLSTLDDAELAPKAAATVERVGRSFVLIETLLRALLDMSKLESPDASFSVSDFPLREVIEPIRAEYADSAAHKGLSLRVVGSDAWVRSDARYLLRCVQNLVVNAIQYTESGRVLLGCRRAGDTLRIEVHDTGRGISAADQARIFDAFTRIDSAGAGYGMGLGLSIVDQACRHLGHALRLRSTPGRGSVFCIEVPLARPMAGADTAAAAPAPEAAGAMDVIALVIEDDDSMREALTARLDAWGASVLSAASSAEAVEQARSIGVAPDIILADYQLGEGDDGLAAIHAVRAAMGDAPAIMLTADRSEALKTLALNHDFTLVAKPVQSSRLRPLIDWKTRRPGAAP